MIYSSATIVSFIRDSWLSVREFLIENIYTTSQEFVILLFGSSFGLIDATGLVFGIIWTAVNFYYFYPYVQLFIVPKLTGNSPFEDIYTRSPSLSESSENLPTIDVLIPAYEEGDVIHQSVSSIRRADYPQELINVTILLEPGDDETRNALDMLKNKYSFQAITIPSKYDEIIVPSTYPGTPNKPRALNYGFEQTDGEIVGVIDAEDIVDQSLFSHVYAALWLNDCDYVQGILDMINEDDGWMNVLFRGEYAWWFRWLLPAFHYVGYPVPLGGTTNFVHRTVLEEISQKRYELYGSPWVQTEEQSFEKYGIDGHIPWDPRNVTEDFELGMFLWNEGYQLGLIRAVTIEESPLNVNNWIRQRTRWQKGKMYTFLQYLRHPPQSFRGKFHGLFQSFLPHLAPIHVSGIVILAMIANLLGHGLPPIIWITLTLGLVFIVEMSSLQAYSYWKVSSAPIHLRIFRTILNFTTLLPYWFLLWGAELRAIKQTYRKQFHWEKTTHHGRNIPEGTTVEYDKSEFIWGPDELERWKQSHTSQQDEGTTVEYDKSEFIWGPDELERWKQSHVSRYETNQN